MPQIMQIIQLPLGNMKKIIQIRKNVSALTGPDDEVGIDYLSHLCNLHTTTPDPDWSVIG